MTKNGKTRDQLDGEIIKIRRGLAIYKRLSSPYYSVRMLDSRTKKYVVRSTKETTRINARTAAEEQYETFLNANTVQVVPKNYTFEHFAERLINREKIDGEAGLLHPRLYRNTTFYLRHKTWGSVDYFRNRDVRQITTRDYNEYMSEVRNKAGDLRPTTFNHISSAFSKVMKTARDAGAIDAVIATPRTKRKDNPRSYFRFAPLVTNERDEYKKLLDTAAIMAKHSQTESLQKGAPTPKEQPRACHLTKAPTHINFRRWKPKTGRWPSLLSSSRTSASSSPNGASRRAAIRAGTSTCTTTSWSRLPQANCTSRTARRPCPPRCAPGSPTAG